MVFSKSQINLCFGSIFFLAMLLLGPVLSAEPPSHSIERFDGSTLYLTIEENRFRITLKDAAGVAVETPWRLATIRYDGPRVDKSFVRLKPTDDRMALGSNRFVQRPWHFQVWLRLYVEGEEAPAETWRFPFRG